MTVIPPRGQRASAPQMRDISTLQDSFEPSYSDVIGAYQSQTYMDVGSAYYTEGALLAGGGAKIAEDQWKTSPYYRDSIKWEEGLDTGKAQFLSEVHDRSERDGFILSKATTAQTAVGLAGAFATGIVEPKNVIEGAIISKGVGLIAGVAAGSSLVTVKRLAEIWNDAKSYKAMAARGATEGVLSAAVAEPSNIMSAKTIQEEYGIADSMFNLATSVGFGVTMHVGGKFFKDRKAAAIAKSDLALKTVVDDVPLQESHAEALVAVQEKAKAEQEVTYFEKAKEEVKAALSPQEQVKFEMHDEILDIENNKASYAYGIDNPEVINALETIRTQEKSVPDKSLFKFLKSKGGVRSEGGEFKAMGISGKTLPGMVNNKTGMTLDDAAIAAHEAGLIGNPDSKELLSLMDEVNRGLHKTTGADKSVDAAEQFLSDEGISATEYIEKYNKAAPELDKRIASLKEQAGPDPYVAQRQNLASAQADVAAYPPDSELLPNAKEAVSSIVRPREAPPVEVMPKEEFDAYTDEDKALQTTVDSYIDDGTLSEAEALQMETDIEDRANGIKAAVGCLLGKFGNE